MKVLSKPQLLSSQTFSDCVNGVIDQTLQGKMLGIATSIETWNQQYDSLAQRAQLHTITKTSAVGAVNKDELVSLYKNAMADSKGASRHHYNFLREISNKCPYCLHQLSTTLDHYLSKSTFPQFAVNPLNLVPSCKDCNINKGCKQIRHSHKQTLHPYYDHSLINTEWLYAKVIEISPVSLEFEVRCRGNFTHHDEKRLRSHFDRFKLARLYNANASTEITDLWYGLQAIHNNLGMVGVREHLRAEATSRRAANRNSWQCSMYEALVRSDWYCDGGFASF